MRHGVGDEGHRSSRRVLQVAEDTAVAVDGDDEAVTLRAGPQGRRHAQQRLLERGAGMEGVEQPVARGHEGEPEGPRAVSGDSVRERGQAVEHHLGGALPRTAQPEPAHAIAGGLGHQHERPVGGEGDPVGEAQAVEEDPGRGPGS